MHWHILTSPFPKTPSRDYQSLYAQSGASPCGSHCPFSNYCYSIRNHSRTFYYFNTRNNWASSEAGLLLHFDIMNHIIHFVLIARAKLWLIKMNIRFQGINFKYFYSKIVKVLCSLTCIANFFIAFENKKSYVIDVNYHYVEIHKIRLTMFRRKTKSKKQTILVFNY